MTMRPGLTISTLGHALLLAWGLVTFSSQPFEAAQIESLPVDIISPAEFSKMVAGSKTAKTVTETPTPLVEKIGEQKAVDDPQAKVVEKKPEIKTASAVPTAPPLPEPKPPKETKVEDKKPKLDAIAEALKKEEAKKPDPPKPQAPPKKPPQKLDMSQIENKLALLDKRDMRREAATGAVLNPKASAGLATASAPTLSQNEIDALLARLRDCWDIPIGQAEARNLSVLVRIRFRPDGSLAAEPTVLNRLAHPSFQVAADSAVRAILKCAPYSFMPVAKYESWKDLELNFDPRDMYRG
jgi:outer membrane biosynthesis protein TonB